MIGFVRITAGLVEITRLPFKAESSVMWSVVNTVGLDSATRLPFKADSLVTEAVVCDLLVRGLLMSLTYAEAPLVVEPWISELETCLVVRWTFAVFDICS